MFNSWKRRGIKRNPRREPQKVREILARKSGSCGAVGIRKGIPARSVIALPEKIFFAMVRDNGRILDDFKCVVGGTDNGHPGGGLRTRQDLQQPCHRSTHRQDAEVAEGPGSTEGAPLRQLEGHLHDCVVPDASVLDSTFAGIPAEEFLRTLEDPENGKESAAVRWAVRLSANEKLVIQLHGLPAAAAVLNGKR
jgi:hypothetical protein